MITEPERLVGGLPKFLTPMAPYLVVTTINSSANPPYKFVCRNLPLLLREWESFLNWVLCLPNLPHERQLELVDLLDPSWEIPSSGRGFGGKRFCGC